jgi:hypothetical protein
MNGIRHQLLCERSRGQSARIASFDPTIMCTTYDYDMFTLGLRLEDVRAKLPEGLSIEERLTYVLKYSALFHERRHFHDLIGTTYGLKLFYYGQRLLNQFLIECLPYLRQLRTAQVPFVSWAERPDCPDEILTFIETYRRLSSETSWLTAILELPRTYTSQHKLSAYAPEGGATVPVIRFRDERQYYALGGFGLEEGAAFVIENRCIRETFGEDYEALYNSQTMALPGGKDYLAAMSFFFATAQSWNLDLFLGACDYALNVGSGRDFRIAHPGWRFALLSEQLGYKNTSSHADALRLASERLEKNAGWPSPRTGWEDAVEYCRRQIEHNQDFYSGTQSVIGFANMHYYSMAKTVFEKRLANTISYQPSWDYFESWKEFPSPPLSLWRVGEKLDVTFRRNQDEEAIVGLWMWASLWETVGRLVEGDGLTCLQDQNYAFSVDCPQHPHCGSAVGRSPCKYGEFIRHFGLDSIQWLPATPPHN